MLNFIRSFSSQKQTPRASQKQEQKQQEQKQNQNFYSTVPKLRERFAEELLNLELDIESDDITMDKVMQLLNLYKEAVEYFEAIQSKKYLIFKNKIQNLFAKKNVMALMKVTPKKPPTCDLKKKIQQINEADQRQNADDMILKHEKQQEQLNTIIHDNLEAQNNQIKERLQKRRSSQARQQQQQISPILTQAQDDQLPSFNSCHTPAIKNQTKYYREQRGRQTFDS